MFHDRGRWLWETRWMVRCHLDWREIGVVTCLETSTSAQGVCVWNSRVEYLGGSRIASLKLQPRLLVLFFAPLFLFLFLCRNYCICHAISPFQVAICIPRGERNRAAITSLMREAQGCFPWGGATLDDRGCEEATRLWVHQRTWSLLALLCLYHWIPDAGFPGAFLRAQFILRYFVPPWIFATVLFFLIITSFN
jgi:hypothetical protein